MKEFLKDTPKPPPSDEQKETGSDIDTTGTADSPAKFTPKKRHPPKLAVRPHGSPS
jgi:hypothetical protein